MPEEIKLFSEPEELIEWLDENDILMWLEVEDAQILLQILAVKAKAADMNEAEYLRFLISGKPNDYPEIRILLRKLINEVNHIGVNINQIVANNNSKLYSSSDKTQLINNKETLPMERRVQ